MMLRRLLGLFAVGAMICPLNLPALTYTKADSLKVVQLLDAGKKQTGGTNLTLFFAEQFVGVPYVASTLEVNPNEELVVNLRQLDCTTLVENVVALALTVREAQPTFVSFCRNLEKIRYREGRLDGYSSRNHYFSEWIASNESQGVVKEIKGEKGKEYRPFIAVKRLRLDYMSTHPDAYPMLKGRADEISRIRRNEQKLENVPTRYVPLSLLDKGKEVLGTIHDGDILAIVTRKKGLDTSHLGFAVWRKGCLHLLNASSIHKKVVLESMTLGEYMRKHPSQLGVRVVRVI